MASTSRDVTVVGAGAVGVCCALYLQRCGLAVTLVDRDEPGNGCSAGAAGNLGGNAHHAIPGLLFKVPGMLLDPLHPLSVRWRDMPTLIPWFLRHLGTADPARAARIADAGGALAKHLFSAYEPLLAEAQATDMIQRRGRLFVYQSEESFAADRYGLEFRRRRGIRMDELSGDEARAIEPVLGPLVKRAVFTPEAGHTVNPQRLVQALAESFVRGGGRLVRDEVRGIEIVGGRPLGLRIAGGNLAAETVVIAAGVWSRPLAADLGTRIPLVAERGYHVMLPDPGVAMRIPTLWADRKVIVTPMEHGLRVSGIADFADIDRPPRMKRCAVLLDAVRRLVPGVRDEGHTRWMGQRPVTPDYLPIIGRSPNFPSVLFAFGHGHSGIGLGAITGKLIAELASGAPTTVDLAPYRPDRF